MNKQIKILSLSFAALMMAGALSAAHAAGDAAAGHEKASGCANCHGADGKGRVPLAGKKEAYLLEQLQAFKSGARQEAMMNMLTKKLSDADMADLAAYFAAQK